MRFTRTRPKYGTFRTVTKFLWFPIEITVVNDNGTTTYSKRWLETATYEELFTRGRIGDFWKKIRWIPND